MSRRHAAAASLTLFDGAAVVEPERLVAGVDEAGRGPLAGHLVRGRPPGPRRPAAESVIS